MTTNATIPGASPALAMKTRKHARRPVGGTNLGRDASAQAKRLAAAILEVLAGVRTTTDAATAVGLSLTRYYQVESRALAGLLRACEPVPKGRQPSEERELTTLRRTQERLQRELARQQTLARLAQRSLGLAAPATTSVAKTNGKKPRRRRPVARACRSPRAWELRRRHNRQRRRPTPIRYKNHHDRVSEKDTSMRSASVPSLPPWERGPPCRSRKITAVFGKL